MYDITHLTKFIFKNKDEYSKLTDNDKEALFFMLNRRLARGLPFNAEFLNKKSIDRASSTDIWYYYFIKQRFIDIPKWFWFKFNIKTKSAIGIKKEEREFLLKMHDINEQELDFLTTHYLDDVMVEVKKFRKFNKKGK